ncbi:MAG: hypothetical protein AAFW65_08305 [Pseudomonadota bacterium]
MMTVQPIDIALFLVSFAACFYCLVLSRRLKALHDTKDGIGATIMALSKSISTMSTTTDDTRARASEMATQLSGLMDEADRMCARVKDLTRTMEKTQEKASQRVNTAQADMARLVDDVQGQSEKRILEMTGMMRDQATDAQTELTTTVRGLLEDSKDRIDEMTALMRQMQALTESAKAVGREASKGGAAEPRPIFKVR